MPVGDDTEAYRGRLPHLVKPDRMYYVTFCTHQREILPARARDLVLAKCVEQHEGSCWLDCIVVMPDHVHLIVMPYETIAPADLFGRIKGGSAFAVNRLLGRSRQLWQRESFDRIIRSDENLDQKREYVLNNPVRAGLVANVEDYAWNWWSEKAWSGGL